MLKVILGKLLSSDYHRLVSQIEHLKVGAYTVLIIQTTSGKARPVTGWMEGVQQS